MSNTFSKILSIFMAVLFVITATLGFLFYYKIVPLNPKLPSEIPDGTLNAPSDLNPDYILYDTDGETVIGTVDLMKYVNWILMYTVILLVAVVFVSFVVNPILKVISNPKAVLRSVISIIVLAIVLGVSYSLAVSEPIALIGEVVTDELTLKLSGASLYGSYILTALIILSIIVLETKKLLKL